VARVVVHVMPKAEILDPQGQAIVGALGRLGHAGISDVRQGKRFEVDVAGELTQESLDMLRKATEELLVNTEVEDYEISLVGPYDEDDDHEGHDHDHEGHDHDHEGHDHDHEGHDHEHEGHDHGQDVEEHEHVHAEQDEVEDLPSAEVSDPDGAPE